MPAEPTPKRTSLLGILGYIALIAFGVAVLFGVQALARHWNLESPTDVVREAKKATAAPQVELVLHVLATLAAVILLGAFLGGVVIAAGFGYVAPTWVGLALCVPGVAFAIGGALVSKYALTETGSLKTRPPIDPT